MTKLQIMKKPKMSLALPTIQLVKLAFYFVFHFPYRYRVYLLVQVSIEPLVLYFGLNAAAELDLLRSK